MKRPVDLTSLHWNFSLFDDHFLIESFSPKCSEVFIRSRRIRVFCVSTSLLQMQKLKIIKILRMHFIEPFFVAKLYIMCHSSTVSLLFIFAKHLDMDIRCKDVINNDIAQSISVHCSWQGNKIPKIGSGKHKQRAPSCPYIYVINVRSHKLVSCLLVILSKTIKHF